MKSKFKILIILLNIIFIFLSCNYTNSEPDPESTQPLRYVFHDSVTELPIGVEGNAGEDEKYVIFGDYPQSAISSNVANKLHFDISNKIKRGYFEYIPADDGNYYVLKNDIYYKVEPIKWHILNSEYNYDKSDASKIGKLLVTDSIIENNIVYYSGSGIRTSSEGDTINLVNYKYSQVRAFLNGYEFYYADSGEDTSIRYDYCENGKGKGFLQSAFSEDAQLNIINTQVDNSTESMVEADSNKCSFLCSKSEYACDDTFDKVFLLSINEISQRNVQIRTNYRKSKLLNKGITQWVNYDNYLNDNNGNGYLLRSPYGYDSEETFLTVRFVILDGYYFYESGIDYNGDGMVTNGAIKTNINSRIAPAIVVP